MTFCYYIAEHSYSEDAHEAVLRKGTCICWNTTFSNLRTRLSEVTEPVPRKDKTPPSKAEELIKSSRGSHISAFLLAIVAAL